jgi:hypothetical protein
LLTEESGRWEFGAEEFREIWAHHLGREREFFGAAARWFKGLNRSDVEYLLGDQWCGRQKEIVNSAGRAGRE